MNILLEGVLILALAEARPVRCQEIMASVVVQKDGGIVSAGDTGGTHVSRPKPGTSVVQTYHQFGVKRLNRDGSRDEGFGDQGIARILPDCETCEAADVVLQQDGKIIAVGRGPKDYGSYLVTRLLPDGKPDPGFGKNGIVRTSPAPMLQAAKEKALGTLARRLFPGNPVEYSLIAADLQGDGKILALGYYSYSGFGLVRYHPNGKLDRGFGHRGIASLSPSFATEIMYRPAGFSSLPDGKIVVVGSTRDSPFMARFLPTGKMDKRFGAAGIVSIDACAGGSGSNGAHAVAGAPDGAILVGGVNRCGFFLARYLEAGKIDSAFGESGIVYLDVKWDEGNDSTKQRIEHIKPLPDGGILVVGTGFTTKEAEDPSRPVPSLKAATLFAYRFDKNGRIDAKFGDQGKTHVVSAGVQDFLTALAEDGTVVGISGFGEGGLVRLDQNGKELQ